LQPIPIAVVCPTTPIPNDPDGRFDGCGFPFTAAPDHEGIVDCPNCGLWFLASEHRAPWDVAA